jgi:hypothetical protein
MQLRKPSVLLGAVLLAVSLSACAVPTAPGASNVPTPQPSMSSVAATASATPSSTAEPTLGPDGVGSLKLGMTKAEATASGQATGITGTTGSCGANGDGRLLGANPADQNDLDGKLFFSTTGKLVIIGATSALATPEGIHLGSSRKDLKNTYPSWHGSDGNSGPGFVKAPGNPKAYYRISIDAGQVLELTLQSTDQDCAE